MNGSRVTFKQGLFRVLRLDVARLLIQSFSFILIFSGCAPSPLPTGVEITSTRPPTFGGSSDASITVASTSYDLRGECDNSSYGIEYSFDEQAWTEVEGGCVNAAFTISDISVNPRRHIYARARTKFSTTATAHALLLTVPAPTSPETQFVTSGRADQPGQASLPNIIGHGFTGIPSQSASHRLNLNLPGVVYDGAE